MNDPYKILGVTRDASDDAIKEAYRTLAKKYHPDNYTEGHIKELVEEKMKEINEAYDEIQRQRATKTSYKTDNSDSYSYGYADSSKSDYSYETRSDYGYIRELINKGRINEAMVILNGIQDGKLNAEWNFLMGCCKLEGGYYFEAEALLRTACYIDPSNAEYQAKYAQIKGNSAAYGNPYRQSNSRNECSGCDMCGGLMCADCICEMLGGDLIRCC